MRNCWTSSWHPPSPPNKTEWILKDCKANKQPMQSVKERQMTLQQHQIWKNILIWYKRAKSILLPESPPVYGSEYLQKTAMKKTRIMSLIAHMDFPSQLLLEWCNLFTDTTSLEKNFHSFTTLWSFIGNLLPAALVLHVTQPSELPIIFFPLYLFFLPVLDCFSCHLNKTNA